MKWTKIELAGLAAQDGTRCDSSGVRREKDGDPVPCGCVFRTVFRSCYNRFRECAIQGKFRSHVSFDRLPQGRSHRGTWSRKEEEYIADFTLVSRRALDAAHYKIFRYHFLLGASCSLCCPRLGLSRGNFYHAIYRIEEHLGRVFYELKPYALYPTRDYFSFRHPGPMKPCRPEAQSLLLMPQHGNSSMRLEAWPITG